MPWPARWIDKYSIGGLTLNSNNNRIVTITDAATAAAEGTHGTSRFLRGALESRRQASRFPNDTSSSWSPDDLDLFEPRPITQCANKAQIYELHGYKAMWSSSGGLRQDWGREPPSGEEVRDVGVIGRSSSPPSSSSSSVGFHVRDGPVPIGREYDDDGRVTPRSCA